MNIGIIVHSLSGHTYSAARKLQEKLAAGGHKVTIEQVTPAGKAYPGIKNLKLKTKPEIKSYEGLVLAAPVWAFSISPVMAAYLAGLTSLKGKKIAAFVTMGFPFKWMGGTRAISQLEKACGAKEGNISATAIICRSGRHRQALNNMVENLSGAF